MKKSGIAHTKDMLNRHALRVKKQYGQNFLLDQNILDKIVKTAAITPATTVIEIGPGLGALTGALLETGATVIAYEIDGDFIPLLKEHFAGPTFHLIHDDVLKRDLDADLTTLVLDPKDVVVVANLPYYITTPILMQCLEETTRIDRMVVMMQLEVAKRVSASTNTKAYNALSLAVQYRAITRFAFKVPRQVFMPAPHVDSGVVTLEFTDIHRQAVVDEPFFFTFIKQAFAQRRKTLLNNLQAWLLLDKGILIEWLESQGVSPQIRAEALELKTMINLANFFYKQLEKTSGDNDDT
ncbi:MAG: 16S rRNA (adenine(1518)-N(6)/adenine(1519)-N(6))-dimethyltransferase RsmA [Acholeplasmatales bacterium]|nr:MAG: 16S rRNA (adenine(1518)-N(6)/adenine(1519)-N(6))-dimethyltransferase RsmA [Acholeplasmatales bacterium]